LAAAYAAAYAGTVLVVANVVTNATPGVPDVTGRATLYWLKSSSTQTITINKPYVFSRLE
jgi:hypothetical protein